MFEAPFVSLQYFINCIKFTRRAKEVEENIYKQICKRINIIILYKSNKKGNKKAKFNMLNKKTNKLPN